MSHVPEPGVRRRPRQIVSAVLATLAMVVVGLAPAHGAVATSAPVVINEVYGGGGNSGSTLTHDFVELYNPGAAPVDLAGWSVQYASSAGTTWSGVIPLTGSIAAGGTYLVQGASQLGGGTVSNLPPADATGTANFAATNGNVALVSAATALTCVTSACATDPAVVDLVGFGTGMAFAGTAAAPAPSNTTSVTRTGGANTADNRADFTVAAPTPTASGTTPPPPPAGTLTIAEVQGTGASSPYVGQQVTTTGIVTAAYPTGGFAGFVIQTPGTGGPTDPATRTASDAVFVHQTSGTLPAIGQHLAVTGTVSEYYGLTELTIADATGYAADADAAAPVTASVTGWPTTADGRERLESMLVAPVGDFTVTNTYATNQYGEVGLAAGTTPLLQPTDVARPGSAEAAAVVADDAARGVVLDDGASTNFLSAASSGLTPPYVSLANPVRVGAHVDFRTPLIVDYRNSTWKLNPTSQVTDTTPLAERAQFSNTRTSAPDATALGSGALRVASFNVLNYFTTLGADVAGCTSYNDRNGNPITVNSCPGNGPRGAWDAA
ncbi:MAG TPA: lamin tail domain-containing protein, partial [Cellulomonadaceae bacterium]|nr:lamin tail domain-containing protein [Cellulomonadaceae bacterium]